MRKTSFANNEFYHIYNRGVDKRNIVTDRFDAERFLQSMEEFNTIEPIGSIYENSFSQNKSNKRDKPSALVEFICYCLNPNHFHFILEQVVDRGIEKFMHRLGTGFTKYFNQKYERSGSLFQGPYKVIHIENNDYLLHLSAYVNLNNRTHQLGSLASKLVRSSWEEYANNKMGICEKEAILDQFKTQQDYKVFAEEVLLDILEKKREDKELEKMLID